MLASLQEFLEEVFIERLSYFDKAPLCNLNVEHGISILGFYFPLCARCTGIVLELLICPFLLIKNIHRYNRVLTIISVVLIFPCVIDGIVQTFTVYESNSILRLISGFLFSHGILLIVFRVIDFAIEKRRQFES